MSLSTNGFIFDVNGHCDFSIEIRLMVFPWSYLTVNSFDNFSKLSKSDPSISSWDMLTTFQFLKIIGMS